MRRRYGAQRKKRGRQPRRNVERVVGGRKRPGRKGTVPQGDLHDYQSDYKGERKVERRTAPLEAPLGDHSKHPEEKTEQGEELQDGQRPVPVGAEGEWSPEEEREEDDAAELVETLDCRASDHLPLNASRQSKPYRADSG